MAKLGRACSKWCRKEYTEDTQGVKQLQIVEFVYKKHLAQIKEFGIDKKSSCVFMKMNIYYKSVILSKIKEELTLIVPKKIRKTRKKIEKANNKRKNPKNLGSDFYYSIEWLKLKNKVLKLYKCGCMKCGAVNQEKHVDHIFPRSLYPKFELDIHNLQILCRKCNMEKSNKNTIDYRTIEQKKLCSLKYT